MTQWQDEHAFEEDMLIMKEYLLLKLKLGDYHGVSDAANDMREMKAMYDRAQVKEGK